MISQLFNEYVYMPKSGDEWIAECKGFIEKYKFPCVGACMDSSACKNPFIASTKISQGCLCFTELSHHPPSFSL